jgi:hypothetical protein
MQYMYHLATLAWTILSIWEGQSTVIRVDNIGHSNRDFQKRFFLSKGSDTIPFAQSSERSVYTRHKFCVVQPNLCWTTKIEGALQFLLYDRIFLLYNWILCFVQTDQSCFSHTWSCVWTSKSNLSKAKMSKNTGNVELILAPPDSPHRFPKGLGQVRCRAIWDVYILNSTILTFRHLDFDKKRSTDSSLLSEKQFQKYVINFGNCIHTQKTFNLTLLSFVDVHLLLCLVVWVFH